MRIKFIILLYFCLTTSTILGVGPGQKDCSPELDEKGLIPERNQQIIDSVIKYGPFISSTYKKAVCTELIIPIIAKFHKLDKIDKNRIRIITNQNIQTLLKGNSPIPKGVYYALVEKGIGESIDKKEDVLPGDFVQFWTSTWGHCGILKSIDIENNTMELYSSFPSTNGYGVQRFRIPEYCFFVRMK
ncbi:hypothetical protein [Dysgonomonas sp. ZJ709]|uniref:hypothetical protein n=1 Tax=Dysgonomonas sp. ZJ709 TaxID=2709797 RepID=UPI0013EA4B3B|nr:hypothetical protein [Dysgonomonas sp. ZJ709]